MAPGSPGDPQASDGNSNDGDWDAWTRGELGRLRAATLLRVQRPLVPTASPALVHPLELEAWISGRGSVGGSGTDDAAAAPPPALLLTDPSAASATPICL